MIKEKKHALIIGDVNSVAEYLNFNEFNYSIITSEYEETTISESIKLLLKAIYTLKTPSHFDATCFEVQIESLLDISKKIESEIGKINTVIATHEHTVLPSAYIRTNLKVPGLSYNEALLLRDKKLMKEQLKGKVRTLKSITIDKNSEVECVKEFLYNNNQVIIKPVNQAGSYGVVYFNDLEKAIAYINSLESENNVILEEYVSYPVYHFDGLIMGGELQFISVAEKVGNCFDFVSKRNSLSTILINDKGIIEKAEQFTKSCLSSLKINSTIFHLEVFKAPNGEFIFLEIAGRYPGSGITNIIKKAYNLNLVEISFLLDSNTIEKDFYKINYPSNNIAMMKVATPKKADLRVIGLSGLDNIPNNIYKSEILSPGNIFEYSSIDAFKSVATFHIEDKSSELVKETITYIEKNMKIYYEEV